MTPAAVNATLQEVPSSQSNDPTHASSSAPALPRIAPDNIAGIQPVERTYLEQPGSSPPILRTVDESNASAPPSGAGSPTIGDTALLGPDGKAVSIDKFKIVRPLGAGGQASTQLAFDPDLNRHVVLKIYHQARTPEQQEAVLREGRALARVRSPFVAQCYNVERRDGVPYLVMEYIPGENLEERRRSQPPSLEPALEWICKAAEGLAAVHACGLLHRDLKPGNIIIGDDDDPHLVDFGLAAPVASEQLTHLSGTLTYMAPEQARREVERIDPRTDIFGLGGVLYFLLTGRSPRTGRTQQELYEAAASKDIRPANQINPKIPPSVNALCMKCLARSPANRFASARELADAVSGLQKSRKLKRMAFLGGAAAGIIAAVLLLILAGSWLFSSDDGNGLAQNGKDKRIANKKDKADGKKDPNGNPVANGKRPRFLQPLGENEMPAQVKKTLMVDPLLSQAEPGGKVYLTNMVEFDLSGFPFGWRFGKNGKLGDRGNSLIAVGKSLYPLGLGLHPPDRGYGRACYVLGAHAESLHGSVAINNSQNDQPAPPLRFVLMGDGKVLWRSKVINKYGDIEKFDVNVHGIEVLELRTHTIGGSNQWAHAVWLDPYVIAAPKAQMAKAKSFHQRIQLPSHVNETPLPATKPFDVDPQLAKQSDGKKMYLSQLQDFAYKTGIRGAPLGKNGIHGDGRTKIMCMGKFYPKGLEMHMPFGGYVRVCYALGGRVGALHGAVGLDDVKGFFAAHPTRFVIYGDNNILWRSKSIEQGMIEKFAVDVRGIDVLELRIYSLRGGHSDARADWLDPYVVTGNAKPAPVEKEK